MFSDWTYNEEGDLFKPTGELCSKVPDGRGYLQVMYQGERNKQHRIIHYLATGEWPEQVDHKDRDKENNRPDNLRSADNSLNQHNKGMQKNNTTGHKGVLYRSTGIPWVAAISIRGKRMSKRFDTKDEAIAQRKQWELLL